MARQATGGIMPLQETRNVPLFDVPEHQTVSSGLVVALLTRHVHAGQWVRTSAYYALDDRHRARNFTDEQGQVWSACEMRCETPWGWRIRLVIAPIDGLTQRLADASQGIAVPLTCSAALG